MNSIRAIKELNKRELEHGISAEASWHADYRDTAYIYIGGLPLALSEGDVITIFSQYGEPTYINLIRDKETGKSKGFAFLKYEDQRSTDLAVDNLGGAVIDGRTLKVDHTRYKKKDDQPDEGFDLTAESMQIEEEDSEGRRKRRRTSESEEERPMLQEEIELAKLLQDHDEEDPMKAFLVQEKKEEVALALARVKGGKKAEKKDKSHKHRHRSRRLKEEDEEMDGSRHSRHQKEGRERRSRSREGSPPLDTRSGPRKRYRDTDDRAEEYQPRRRSPRRDSRDREGRDRGSKRQSRRDDYRDGYHRGSRRDS